MNSTKRLIFSSVFLFISTFSFSQNVFVANDFGACGVGLRDSSGHWLAQPVYQEIIDWPNGYFRTLLGSKEGVLDSTGQTVIPPIYDYVLHAEVKNDTTRETFFYVFLNGKEGLLNAQNKFIVPLVCRSIDVSSDGAIIAQTSKKRYSIYNTQGKETVIPKKQPEEPVALGGHLYQVSRNVFGITFERKVHYRKFKHHPLRRKRYRRRSRLTITCPKRYGVINDSLQAIVPKKFTDITYHPSGNNKLIRVEKGKRNGYYSIAGKEIWAPVFIEENPFTQSYFTGQGTQTIINHYGFTAVKYKGKYGIIAVNGDTILPFIYSSIYMPYSTGMTNTNWYVKNNVMEGIYNPYKRKWVLEPVYQYLNAVRTYTIPGDSTTYTPPAKSYSYTTRNPNGLKIIIAKKNGKYGIITSAGQELLPFIYDDYNSNMGAYCFRKDSSYWMVSLPLYHEKANRFSSYIVSTAPADLQFKKITREDGVTLFINADLLTDSAQMKCYEIKKENYVTNPETYDHFLHATAMIIEPLRPANYYHSVGNTYSYHTTDLNYLESDSSDEFIINSYDQLVGIQRLGSDNFHSYYSLYRGSGIFREDGSWLLPPGSYSYAYTYTRTNGLLTFKISCDKNKTGLIDGNGKLLLDTVWTNIGSSGGSYFWVQEKPHRYFHKKYNYDWNILDTTKHELLFDRESASESTWVWGANAVVINKDDNKKLFNLPTRSYVLEGNVNNIFRLDSLGNYYAVRTCYGNIGIIDGNGKWVVDTVWKALINATNKPGYSGSRFSREEYYKELSIYKYVVLSDEKSWKIFDAQTGTIKDDTASMNILLNLSFNSFVIDSIRGVQKFCADCPSAGFADTTKEINQLTNWQKNLLFDSLFTGEHFILDSNHFWYTTPCPDCLKRNGNYYPYTWSKNYDREELHHIIGFQNDSCISVARQNFTFYSQDPKDLFFTTMLFSDGIHSMLLDSLFTGNEWEKFIADETTLYFESHPNIKGNCHNPMMLPMIMKDRFMLTANGIELYPPNYKENNQQLSVPVSWEKLKPYLRKDVARKLGIK
jgi:hypothetical protein